MRLRQKKERRNNVRDVRSRSDVEKCPGARGRRCVLTGHEECDQDVGNLMIGQWNAVAVALGD